KHCPSVCNYILDDFENSLPAPYPDIFKLCSNCNHHHSEKCTFCSESHCPSKCTIILADFEDSPPPIAPSPSLAQKQPRLDYRTGTCKVYGEVFTYKGALDAHYQQHHGSTAAEPLYFTQEAHEEVCGFKKKWGAHSCRYDEKVEEYKKVLKEKKLNFDGLVFPMTLSQFPKFEEQNPGIALSVFGSDAARSEYFKYRDKPLCALTRLQQKSVHRAIRNSTFPLYMSQRIAEFELKDRIQKSNESKTDVPEEPYYFFNQYHRMVRTPYRYYGDFEAFVKPKTRKRNANGLEVEESNHIPCGYAWVCVDWQGKAVKWSVYRTDDEEENVAKRFFDEILQDHKLRRDVIQLLQQQSSKSMIINPQLRDSLTKQIREDPTKLDPCYFCGEKFKKLSQEEMSKEFKDRPNMAVCHHDHCSGKFVALAHNRCNLEASISTISPCFIHNLKSYDSHFLVQAFDETMEATIIPCSSEKFMSFTVNKQIRFCDSFSFLSSSLENLTNTLKKNNTDDFKLTKEIFCKAENILKLIAGPIRTFFIGDDSIMSDLAQ
ncbi:hypothetical protein Fcan01_22275, partial [Folsomia candida]